MRIYCLDSNALIEPWNKYYTVERCPEYWDIIDQLAQQGTVFCALEVKHEIEKSDDGLKKWIHDKPYLFREETPEVNANIRLVLAKFPELIDSSKNRSMADPWVIAHAMSDKAIVVTKELPNGSASKKIKIPDVCNAFGVEWMNDFDFVDEIGIKFSASLI